MKAAKVLNNRKVNPYLSVIKIRKRYLKINPTTFIINSIIISFKKNDKIFIKALH